MICKKLHNGTFWIPSWCSKDVRDISGKSSSGEGVLSDVWVNHKFDSVWINHLGRAQHTVTMEEQMDYCDFVSKDANVKILKKTTENVIKSNKCNQCEYASSNTGHLRRHLKTHSGEKSYKCNQCEYASSQTVHLRRHLKTHSGEKSN